jgi:hypothetical protein
MLSCLVGMDHPSLRPDCGRCAALCCLLAFDRSELFAFDKPAGRPCRHLDGHACAIHGERERRGFAGCVSYDCLGAGQRVTQQLFGGRSWRDDPALAGPMLEAFLDLRQIHEWLRLLDATTSLPLDAAQRRTRESLEEALRASRHDPAEVRDFLYSLRAIAPRRLRVLSCAST